jgi:hypothetical protein
MRVVRRDIARIATVIREREVGIREAAAAEADTAKNTDAEEAKA